MKRRILCLALALFVCLSALPVGALAASADSVAPRSIFAAGDGTEASPYEIPDLAALEAFREYIITDPKHGFGQYFKLTRDIDLNGSDDNQWTPIGTSEYPFAGTFDGGNHKVSGLYINSGVDYQGLFGYITNGTVKNLTVKGTILALGYVGGIVGNLDPTTSGRIENCEFDGEIGESGNKASNTAVGGIVGSNHGGTVTGCHFTGKITRNTEYVGGIVGQNISINSVVENCHNEGEIFISGNVAGKAGGIAGINNNKAQIINCRNSGTVNGAGSTGLIGGITGANNDGKLRRCYNAGSIDGGNSGYAGGIAGQNSSEGEISECYNVGAVTGTTQIGGIAGLNDGGSKLTNCYNEGSIEGTGQVGGIVGQNYGGSSKKPTYGSATNSYNKGSVTGSKNSGGVVGLNSPSGSTGNVKVTNCYYLTGTAKGGIAGSDVPRQAESKTEEQFSVGEVAWMLQNPEKVDASFAKQSELVWVQELVKAQKDPYPLLLNTERGAGHPKVLRITFQTTKNSSYAVEYTNSGGTVPLPQTPPVDEDFLFLEWRETNINGVKFTGPVMGNDDMIVIAVQREKFGAEDANTTVITTTYGNPAEQDLGEWVKYVGGSSSSGKFTYTMTNNGGLTGVTLDGSMLHIPTGINVGEYMLKFTAHEKEPQISPLTVGSYGTSDVTLTVKVVVQKADLTASMFTYKAPNDLSCNGEPKEATVTLNEGYIGVGDTITVKYYKVGSDEALEGPPTEVGQYIVKIDVNEGDNYNSAVDLTDKSWTFTIENSQGNLTVSKTVRGNAGDRDKEFAFIVTLSDQTVTGTYGDMTFTNGVATFTLKHGQSMTAVGLQDEIAYTVTESNCDGYVVTIEDNTIDARSIDHDETLENGDRQCVGKIIKNVTAQVDFTNTRNVSIPTDATIEYGWLLPLFLAVGMGALFLTIKRFKATRQVSIRPMSHPRR